MFKKKVATLFLGCSLLSFSANSSASFLDANSDLRRALKYVVVAGFSAAGLGCVLDIVNNGIRRVPLSKELISPVIMAAYLFLSAHNAWTKK